MAALSHFSASSSSLSPHRLFFHQHHLPCRHELRFVSPDYCSPSRRFAVCAASAKKSRSGRKTKSNIELCNDIKEFLASAGLPEGHIPSMKELLQHGRDDLAYIIRRRGYKLIRELLANSVEMKVVVFDKETNIAEGNEAIFADEEESEGQHENAGYLDEENALSVGKSVEEDCFDELDSNSSSDVAGNSNMHIETPFSLSMKDNTAQDVVGIMIEQTPPTMGTSIMEESSASVDVDPENSLNSNTFMPVETSTNLVTAAEESTTSLGQFEWVSSTSEETSLTNSYDHGHTCKPCAKPSLEDKVAKFMQKGYLEPVEDQLPVVYGEIDDVENPENPNFTESNMSKPGTKLQLETHVGEDSEHVHGGSSGTVTTHITAAGPFSPAKVDTPFSESVEELFDVDEGNNLDEERRKQEIQAEVSHLKFMLHQKELELSQLKEQIEKEKLALEMLQTKAENQISKARKIISEKDAELQDAEECLSGLKEVQIEYSGNGDIVEVAGSFNGWHHPIKMNPHPLATATDTIGSRRSNWSTMLWLYPGTYEIKFIVDGEWRIDPQKESVTRGTICNNVLRVDR